MTKRECGRVTQVRHTRQAPGAHAKDCSSCVISLVPSWWVGVFELGSAALFVWARRLGGFGQLRIRARAQTSVVPYRVQVGGEGGMRCSSSPVY